MEVKFTPVQSKDFKVQVSKSGDTVIEFVIKYIRGNIKVVVGNNINKEELKIEQKSFGTHDLPQLNKITTTYSLKNLIIKIRQYGKKYYLYVFTSNGGYKGRILITGNEKIHLQIDNNFNVSNIKELLQESLNDFYAFLTERTRVPRPVSTKGLPKKPAREYDIDNLRKDKEKWIKWYLSLVKNKHPRMPYRDILDSILKNDGKVKSRSICHKELMKSGKYTDKEAWAFCEKAWLLIQTNKATAIKIVKDRCNSGGGRVLR